jgi:hypothetical protein
MVKKARGYDTISVGTAFMIFHSGFRGGMTMMMALMLDPFWAKNQNTLVIATIISVIGMAYLSGTTGPYLLRVMNVPTNVSQEDGQLFELTSLPSSFLEFVHSNFSRMLHWGCRHEGCDKARTMKSDSSNGGNGQPHLNNGPQACAVAEAV